ncbi:hypothetical protein AMTRI_Chr11g154680 [Amborella trichopoda]
MCIMLLVNLLYAPTAHLATTYAPSCLCHVQGWLHCMHKVGCTSSTSCMHHMGLREKGFDKLPPLVLQHPYRMLVHHWVPIKLQLQTTPMLTRPSLSLAHHTLGQILCCYQVFCSFTWLGPLLLLSPSFMQMVSPSADTMCTGA